MAFSLALYGSDSLYDKNIECLHIQYDFRYESAQESAHDLVALERKEGKNIYFPE
jgi:hypothetical protein